MVELFVGSVLIEGLLYGVAALFGEDEEAEETGEKTHTKKEADYMYQMSVAHRLSAEEALKRVKTILGDLQKRYADKISGLHEKWDGDTGTFSFSAMGCKVSGTLVVKDGKATLSYELPWTAKLFRGTIEEKILEQAHIKLA